MADLINGGDFPDDQQPKEHPRPIDAEVSMPHLLESVYAPGAFRDKAAAPSSVALLAAIEKAPERFGSAQITAAIGYVEPELQPAGGMAQIHRVEFEEPVPDKPYTALYQFSYQTLKADPNVLLSAQLALSAFRLNPGVTITPELAEDLLQTVRSQPKEERRLQRFRASLAESGLNEQEKEELVERVQQQRVMLRAAEGAELLLSPQLFSERKLTFGKWAPLYRDYMYGDHNCLLRPAFAERPQEGYPEDALLYQRNYASFRWDWHLIDEQGLLVEIPGKTSAYAAAVRLKDGIIVIENLGPAPMEIELKSPGD